jgi:hypothetical protein
VGFFGTVLSNGDSISSHPISKGLVARKSNQLGGFDFVPVAGGCTALTAQTSNHSRRGSLVQWRCYESYLLPKVKFTMISVSTSTGWSFNL